MIIGEADLYIPIAIRPNSHTIPHAVNFRSDNIMVGSELKPIHIEFLVDKVALVLVFFR
jgi:hypothetical protein